MRMTLDLLHEFANTEVFCLFHNCMWQSRHSEVNVCFLALCEQTDGLFTFNGSLRSNMICVYVCLRLRLDLNSQQTLAHNCSQVPVLTLVLSQSNKTRLSISWALEWDVCSVTTSRPVLWIGLGFGWVGWEPSDCRATSEPNSFIQSFFKEIFGGGRSDAYTLFENDFSSFHPNNFRETISWECVVKNDCVRSCLTELKSFLQSKFDVDPIHRVLMFLPRFLLVPCKTRCCQVNYFRISMFFVHRIHRRAEYRLSFAQILSSWYQSWIGDGA